jgi:glyoxylase I family protein
MVRRWPSSTQDEIAARVAAAGITEPQTYVLEHGYCRSLYVTDPNGMIVEFTHDLAEALDPALDATRRANARAELKRWLAGDHTNNNNFRREAA